MIVESEAPVISPSGLFGSPIGHDFIPPDDVTKRKIQHSGAPSIFLFGTFTLCLDETGHVCHRFG